MRLSKREKEILKKAHPVKAFRILSNVALSELKGLAEEGKLIQYIGDELEYREWVNKRR